MTGYHVDRPGLPDGEVVAFVPDSLLPEVAALDVDLGAFITEHHRTDLLRVQTLGLYGVASDDEDLRRYLEGAPEPDATGKSAWLGKLRHDTAGGKAWRNVHVVAEPLSDYLRYQFEWCYVPNVAAGQQVHILSIADTPAAGALLELGDFYVIEGTHAARMRYGDNGSYEGAAAIGDDASRSYRALAEMAWDLATPFTEWWSTHPRYHRASIAA